MTAPHAYIALTDFSADQTSYVPPSQHDSKSISHTNIGDRGFSPPDFNVDKGVAPASLLERLGMKIKHLSHKLWLLELGASLISMLIFGAMVLVLRAHDGTIYDDALDPGSRPILFPSLAILGTILRAAMLLPVATAIAQLKWGWYRKERRLIDIERFEGATQGILGSLRLLWAMRFRNIAVVGAALTVLSVPLNAVIQSSVRLSQTQIVNHATLPREPGSSVMLTDKTWAPRSTSYNHWRVIEDPSAPYPPTDIVNVVQFGVNYNNGISTIQKASALERCPTGSCRFNKSQTLGIISQCIDRTSDIQTKRGGGTTPWQWLSGADVSLFYLGRQYKDEWYDSQYISVASSSEWPESDEGYSTPLRRNYGPLLLRTTMLMNFYYREGATDTEIAAKSFASECALSWNIQTLEEFVNVTLTTGRGSEFIPTPMFNSSFIRHKGEYRYILMPGRCFVEGQEIPMDYSRIYNNSCIYTVGAKGAQALDNMFLDSWNGGQGFTDGSWVKNRTANEYVRSNNFNRQLWEIGRRNLTADYFQNSIRTMWGNIALVTTQIIRNLPSPQKNATDQVIWQQLNTTGTVYRLVYIWTIDWPRLGAPAFLVGFSAFFVLITAIVTRKQTQWKRSVLPYLFQGLGEHEKTAVGEVTALEEMEIIAQKLRVRLDGRKGSHGQKLRARASLGL